MQEYAAGQENVTSRPALQAPELAQWLHVSGDLDDFIYYGEEPRASER